MNTFRASLPCAGMAGSAVPPLTAAGQPNSPPSTDVVNPVAHAKPAPAESKGGTISAPILQSPGRSSAFSRRWPFSRRQAVGVVAYLNTGTLTAINSCGVLRHWSSNPRFKFCQEPSRGFAKCFKSFAVSLFHAPNKAWSSKREAQRITVNGAKSYE